MRNILSKVEAVDRQDETSQMNEKGTAFVPSFLSEKQCGNFISQYYNPEIFHDALS